MDLVFDALAAHLALVIVIAWVGLLALAVIACQAAARADGRSSRRAR
jgi:hypothetical protein